MAYTAIEQAMTAQTIFCALLCVALSEHVTLELQFSADNARVPSRALMAAVSIGVPEHRYNLMLDFNSSVMEIDECMFMRSFTYDIVRNDTDMVLFEEDDLADPQPHGYYRFPVLQHCTDVGGMPERFYRSCLDEKCKGILGLGRYSPMWDIWSAFTLTLDALHLGSTNQYHKHSEEYGDVLQCSGSSQEQLCEFEATIGDRTVLVDFHLEDSYVYVPQHIYSLYIAGRDLSGVSGATRLATGSGHVQRQGAAQNVTAETQRFRAALTEGAHKLKNEQLQQLSAFSRRSGAAYRGDLPPLVFRGSTSDATVVVDEDLLLHVPSSSGSVGGDQYTAASQFFGERSMPASTLMLKPRDNNKVSIGNSILRRYTMHKNQLTNTLLLEERLFVEHFSLTELLAALLLYTYFIYSLCHTLHKTVAMGLCLSRQCESCQSELSPYARRRVTTCWKVLPTVFDLLIVAVSVWALVNVLPLLSDDEGGKFKRWLWLFLIVNGLVALLLMIPSKSPHTPPDGTFCWRTFRTAVALSSSLESVALVGLMALAAVIRRENLGSLLTSAIVLAYLFNIWRHLLQAFFYSRAQLTWPLVIFPVRIADFPSAVQEILWIVFILCYLAMLNFGLFLFVSLRFVLLPATRSASLTALLLLATLTLSAWVLQSYEIDIMKQRAFSRPKF